MFFLEAGINHFGEKKEVDKITNFFLKSRFKFISFMIHTEKFYRQYYKKGINFELPIATYQKIISKCHKKKKKIGLSVCDIKTFNSLKHLNFDFYKSLSVSINDENLIKTLRALNKPVFISTGFNSTFKKIKKSLKLFKKLNKITILHTPMTYKTSELNLKKILDLKRIFKLPVGYSNHNNDFNNLNFLSFYNPKAIFIYIKPTRKKNRVYPDDSHALYLDQLDDISEKYNKYLLIHSSRNKRVKIKIFKNEIKK